MECLVAIFIVAVAIIGTITLIATSSRTMRITEDRNAVAVLAGEVMQQARVYLDGTVALPTDWEEGAYDPGTYNDSGYRYEYRFDLGNPV